MAVLTPIRNSIKYIAELFKILTYDPRLAIANNIFGREYNIYSFSIAPLIIDENNYWIKWGGNFDNPYGYGFQIFMNLFLVEVFSSLNLIITENSFYVDIENNLLYMNIPLKPWQYSAAYSGLYGNRESTFSSAPRNLSNLSDVYYGVVRTYPRMKVPSFNSKLNDIISGIIVYNDFSIDVNNADGKFDGFDIIDFFNIPIQVSKTTEDANSIEDFNLIRRGFVSDIKVAFDKIQIKGVDQFYIMNRDFCKKFNADDYPNIPESNINNDIPVAWGSVKNIPLFEIDKDTGDPATWIKYIALDPDYITAISAVYDSDGNAFDPGDISFDSDTGIIEITALDDDGEVIEAESADVTGKANNKIGQVIIDALENNENLAYIEGIWDINETNDYLDVCAEVGFYFDGGTTKDLIENVLKNDNAFLIQKHNGLLTIRQWGQTYEMHTIPTYLATKEPKKEFKDASKYYCSTVKILSEKNHNDDNFLSIYIDNSREAEIFENYRKSFIAEFETDLINEDEIADLAERLLERFGNVRETLEISVGVDTFGINLLDIVKFEANINNRIFSEYSRWIVKECDPGQDIIVMS